jgi:hypothetical protein
VEQAFLLGKRAFPVKTLIVFCFWLMVALPFVGAIAVTDDLRSGPLDPEVVESRE